MIATGRRRTLALATALAAMLGGGGGCGDGDGAGRPDAARTDPASVELGTGEASYQAIADNDSVPLYQGSQGGYHFFVRARVRGLSPGNPATPGLASNPATAFGAFDDSGERVDESLPYRVGYAAAGDGWYELPSPRTLTVDSARVPALRDQRVRLRVEVRDAEDRAADHEVWIRVREVPLPDAGPGDDARDE